MLARTSDTIADSEGGEPKELMEALESYDDFTQGRSSDAPALSSFSRFQTNKSEGLLLENVEAVVSGLKDSLIRSKGNSLLLGNHHQWTDSRFE